jgi:anti-anti-sigma factor
MSTTQYDLKRGVLAQPSVVKGSNPVIDLEQRLLAKLRRNGLMLGLSFEGDILKISLFGVVKRGASWHFKEFVNQIFESGYYRIKVDLSGVEQIDGNGLAVLTWMTLQAQQHKGEVLIHNSRPSIRQVMFSVGAQFMLTFNDYDLAVS